MEVVLPLQIELCCVYRESEYTERSLISQRVVRFEVITVINIEGYCLLGCDAEQSCRESSKFQKAQLPPPPEQKISHPKRQ
jgi:hypothetical protein